MIVNVASAKQVTDYSKKSQGTQKSVDGTNVVGGTAGKIGLDIAAYVFFFYRPMTHGCVLTTSLQLCAGTC